MRQCLLRNVEEPETGAPGMGSPEVLRALLLKKLLDGVRMLARLLEAAEERARARRVIARLQRLSDQLARVIDQATRRMR